MFPVHSRIDLDSMEGLGFWAKKISITLVDLLDTADNGQNAGDHPNQLITLTVD